jgi:cytochrome P450 family 307 subfamily A
MDTSVLIMFSTNTVYLVFVCVVVAILMLLSENFICWKFIFKQKFSDSDEESAVNTLKRAPGPKKFPIIGNLPSMRGYEVPYQAFNDLSKEFGDIISMQLGNVPTMVVNGLDNIREVLISKSACFDGRPNFRRYHQLFSGNKENCEYFLPFY